MSQHRLNMARLAIDGCDGLKVCDVEFRMPVPSYTISTLRELKRIYPDHDFKLIIGSDNWLIFDRWRAFDEIIADFGVVIYPRPGFPLPPDKTLPDNVEIVKAPEIELSSTHIRHCAKKGLDFDVENAKYLAKQAKKQKVKKFVPNQGIYNLLPMAIMKETV